VRYILSVNIVHQFFLEAPLLKCLINLLAALGSHFWVLESAVVSCHRGEVSGGVAPNYMIQRHFRLGINLNECILIWPLNFKNVINCLPLRSISLLHNQNMFTISQRIIVGDSVALLVFRSAKHNLFFNFSFYLCKLLFSLLTSQLYIPLMFCLCAEILGNLTFLFFSFEHLKLNSCDVLNVLLFRPLLVLFIAKDSGLYLQLQGGCLLLLYLLHLLLDHVIRGRPNLWMHCV
jgi:hypothetical protein